MPPAARALQILVDPHPAGRAEPAHPPVDLRGEPGEWRLRRGVGSLPEDVVQSISHLLGHPHPPRLAVVHAVLYSVPADSEHGGALWTMHDTSAFPACSKGQARDTGAGSVSPHTGCRSRNTRASTPYPPLSLTVLVRTPLRALLSGSQDNYSIASASC